MVLSRPSELDISVIQRLRESERAMAKAWPQFSYRLLEYGDLKFGSWRGHVQPIRKAHELFELLDDLDHDREIYLIGDEIRHLPSCGFDHSRSDWMEKIMDLRIRFDLEIQYDGSRAPPRCYVLFPVILTQKHMWSDWSICDSLASDTWRCDEQTVADAVPNFLIWLVKWMVYDQTGAWIGQEHDNTPEYHLNMIKPEDPCWCRRGKAYQQCHREMDNKLSKANGRRPR